MTELEQARLVINEVDKQMAELFCKRMQAVESVAHYKAEQHLPIFDAAREEAVIRKNCAYVQDLRYLPYYEDFIRHNMALSKDYQSTLIHSTVVGYFGAEGSHTHTAAKNLFPCERTVSYDTFEEIFDAVVISTEIDACKPDAKMYLEICRRMGLTPQDCLCVDDRECNLRGAMDCGMAAVQMCRDGLPTWDGPCVRDLAELNAYWEGLI